MFDDMGSGGKGFGGMNYPNNPNGKKDDLSKVAFQLVKGMCILGLCFLVLVVLVKVIPSIGDMIADGILSFFRGIRFGRGAEGIITLGMVLIFIVGIAKLVSNHFRN